VEATVFTFPGAGAAQAWFAPFGTAVGGKANASLPVGRTGSHSAFRYLFGSYELQFVAGSYVGDVFCWAPYTTGASAACEETMRKLAESWYAELSKRWGPVRNVAAVNDTRHGSRGKDAGSQLRGRRARRVEGESQPDRLPPGARR
jgi:hypothetical protein